MKKLILTLLLLASPCQAAILQEDTATSVVLWIYDSTTQQPETGIGGTAVTCRIVKSDLSTSTFTTTSASTNDLVEVGQGAYTLELTSTQLNTAGIFELGCYVTAGGSVIPPTTYDIYPTNSYAASIGGSVASIDDEMETDCSTVANANSPAGRVCGNKFLRYDATGTADSGSTTGIVDTERTEGANHWANRAYIVFTSGSIAGQAAMITASSGSSLTFAPALTTAAGAGDAYEIRSIAGASTGSTDVNVVSWAGTTVATPDTAGYPKVTIKDGTGQGELSITAGQMDGQATTTEIANAVWAGVGAGLLDLPAGVETGLTIRKCFRAIMAVTANKSSGYNTNTPTFRDYNDSKNRITSTTNNTGRTSVTFDLD